MKKCSDKDYEVIENIREELRNDICNGELYLKIAGIYEKNNINDIAYLWYKNSIQYIEDENKVGEIERKLNKLEEVKVRKYSIVIVTYNNLDKTKLCVESIMRTNKNDDYEIIIVDNHSTDGTVKWLKKQKNIKYILNNENMGFPAGCNIGIKKAAKGNDILLLNNDTIVMTNSILNLRLALYSDDKIGTTGATSNHVAYYQQIQESFNSIGEYEKYAERNNVSDEKHYEERIKLIGFAMYIRREVIEEIGLLDERFTPGNYEDDDYCLRMIKAGYKIILCRDSFIYHFGGQTFKNLKIDYNKLMEENMSKFYEKWKFNSFIAANIRFDLINLISYDTSDSIRIMEIGCGCGASLLSIKNKYINSKVYGIENNNEAREISKNVVPIYEFDLENSNDVIEEKSLDVIILTDVLGNYRNQLKVLAKLKSYLKDGGQIIASIYNVMNIGIIENLLRGNWTYESAGILDQNNIRFFTINEIIKLFNNAGFEDLNLLCNVNSLSEDQEKLVGLFKNMFGVDEIYYKSYQYLVSAKIKA